MLLRGCCSQCSSGASDPESTEVSGSEVGAGELRRQQRLQRSSKRRRATYRYEVVYRREEFSHEDYLESEPLNGFRLPEEARPQVITSSVERHRYPVLQQPQQPIQPSVAVVASLPPSDYSHLSNYGRLEDFTQHGQIAWGHFAQHQHYDSSLSSGLSKDLRQYLNTRYAKGSVDHDLQNTIRDNLYLRTVPVTTRSRRNGETDGVDYTFLTVEQFRLLEKNGTLLESGIYDGNFYGTPKPALDSPLILPATPLAQSSLSQSQAAAVAAAAASGFLQHLHNSSSGAGAPSSVFLPGAHPSSEGKRKRNRSNVEAMAAKNEPDPEDSSVVQAPASQHDSIHLSANNSNPSSNNSGGGSSSGSSVRSPNNMSIPSYREEGGGAMGGFSEAELGPLPNNWEKAYTERGEVYFIDHNTGTSQWLDPRLSKIQKKSLEECAEDELPYGWEKIDDPHYGTYYIDHVNRKTQYENPVTQAKKNNTSLTAGNGTGSSTDSGNSTYPRLKKQQQQQQSQQQNEINSSNNNNNNGPPTVLPKRSNSESRLNLYYGGYNRPFFTRNPAELQGERICTTLLKSNRGLGFTIVGGDDSEEEFLQIKSVVPHGPAWIDGRLRTGDVLVYVNETCVLGYTHHDMVNMFQSIAPGQAVALEVCRGYPLPFDPNDPNTEIVTTVAVASAEPKPSRPGSADLLSQNNQDNQEHDHRFEGEEYGDGTVNGSASGAPMPPGKVEYLTVQITKGAMGFGFTIADSAYGQKVKTILDRPRCKNLQEGDILVEINGINMRTMSHAEVVQVLKDCPWSREATITVQRGGMSTPTKSKWKKAIKEEPTSPRKPPLGGLFRSKTPTADLYSAQTKEVVPNRPKTPLVDTRNRPKTPSMGVAMQPHQSHQSSMMPPQSSMTEAVNRELARTPVNALVDQFQNSMSFQDAPNQGGSVGTNGGSTNSYRSAMNRSRSPGRELDSQMPMPMPMQMQMQMHMMSSQHYENGMPPDSVFHPQNNGYPPSFESDYGRMGPRRTDPYAQQQPQQYPVSGYHMGDPSRPLDYGYGYSGMNGGPPTSGDYPEDNLGQFHRQDSGYGTQPQSVVIGHRNASQNSLTAAPYLPHPHSKEGTSFEHEQPYPANPAMRPPVARRPSNGLQHNMGEWMELNVSLLRHETGFGFRIVGGTEEGSQVSIGHIVPGGAADVDGRLRTGDEILSVDGQSVVHTSHHHVVNLMGAAALNGRVTIGVRRWIPAHPHPSSASPQDGVYPRGVDGNIYPYDVTVMRRENEGFGFVIISSVTKGVSFIGQIIRDSPAERCSRLHVGDRILAVNHHDISRLHHGDIVNLIKDSGYTVTLTVGPPLDDTSSNASNSHRQDGSEAIEEDQLYAVELSRGMRGFGFSIRGGREFHNMPLFVLRIAENGSAAQDGRLRVGDQLIEINGINTKNMTHADAIELIKNGGPVVRLLLRRGTNLAPPIGENGEVILSPIATASPTTPSGSGGGGMDLRPNSSLAQPLSGPSYSTPNGPSSMASMSSMTLSLQSPNGMAMAPNHQGPPPYMMGPSRDSRDSQHGPPNGSGGMMTRGPVPAPLTVPPMHRNLNGPLSHSSPRVLATTSPGGMLLGMGAGAGTGGPGGAPGSGVGGDYYWGS